MSEFSPFLSRANKSAIPFTTREQTQREQADTVGRRWQRFLEKKARHIWSRAPRRRRQERLRTEISESRKDFQRYVNVAQFAINLAVNDEPNPQKQLSKKRILMNKWRHMYQRGGISQQ